MADSEKFDLLLEKMETIASKVGDVENRLGSIESKVDGVENRLGTIEGKVDGMEDRLSAIESKANTIDDKVTKVEVVIENEIRTNIKRVAEGHLDLSRKLNECIRLCNDIKDRQEIYDIYINMHESKLKALG